MIGVAIALCAITIMFGERIGVNQGQGWDGMAYTAWAQDFAHHVWRDGLTRYYSQRVLPSGIVDLGLYATGRPPTVANAIFGFQILDSLALVGAAWCWTRIAAALTWNRIATWVGFGALFLSFACARHALYYPTLTDSTAFLLGMVLVWGYVAHRPSLLWVVAVAGTFTWPAIVPHAIVMLLVPRAGEAAEARRVRWLGAAAAAVAANAYTLLSLHYYRAPLPAAGFDKFVTWIHSDLLVATVPTNAALVGLATYCLFAQRFAWSARRWHRYALVLAGVAVLVAVRAWWIGRVGTRGDGPTVFEFACQQSLEALRAPLWGPVHHVVYFGPIVVVAALAWRGIAKTAAAWGPAAIVTMAVVVAFLPGSESRQWVHLLPFVVTIAIAATHEAWTRKTAVVFVACALCWSKLWLHIGYDTAGPWFEFPTQKYFMHLGPWASDTMFLVHLGAVVATVALLYFSNARREPASL